MSFDVSQGTLGEAEGSGWMIGTLEAGESAVLTAVFTVGASPAGGYITNSVVVVPPSGEPDPDVGNNVSEVVLYVPAPPSPTPGPGPSGGGRER